MSYDLAGRAKFLKRLSMAEKEQENEYQRDATDIYKRLSAKNKNKLGGLLERQADERADLEERLGEHMSREEKRDMLALQEQEHQAEQDELNFMLKLEQDEELEKLRKVSRLKVKVIITKGHRRDRNTAPV